MKIKCPQCSFENLKESEFCQECGYKLSSKKIETIEKSRTGLAASLHEEIEKIDDVIFKPKKKGVSFKNIIIGVVVVGALAFTGLLLLASFTPGESGTDEQITSEPTAFPISYLNITDYEIQYDDSGESYFVGVLKNTYSKAVRNVRVRLDFYHDEALSKHFDTRNTIIESGAEPNGAFSFQIPLTFYPQDFFWWIWKIKSADYGL